MSEIIFYATTHDADAIRLWINEEPDVAWIVKVAEQEGIHHWKAVGAIDNLEEQSYALWHTKSGPLNIPSGSIHTTDETVPDPFAGWSEKKTPDAGASQPWFGSNSPGPYSLNFVEAGREAPGSLGRSQITWLEDRYKAIGKGAHPDAKLWWTKLKRFVKKSSVAIPLVELVSGKSPTAYVFPDAKLQIDQGRHRDVNPSFGVNLSRKS